MLPVWDWMAEIVRSKRWPIQSHHALLALLGLASLPVVLLVRHFRAASMYKNIPWDLPFGLFDHKLLGLYSLVICHSKARWRFGRSCVIIHSLQDFATCTLVTIIGTIGIGGCADTLDCRWNRPSESVTCSRSQQPEVTAGMVVGAGPAGLFWHCNCNSQKVVTLNQFYWIEVEQRGRDIDLEPWSIAFAKNGESNFAFGEGGAGTGSDDKLSTRINS